MNLYLNSVEDFSIVREDTLGHPAFINGSKLRTFDIVLANPPYAIKQWNRDAFMNDKWGRNFLGTPPQSKADYAFIQHIIASMDPQSGRCAILLPHGILFRREEKEMREKLVKMDTLEAVIALGHNLFYNSAMISCILVCRTTKDLKHKNKVIFIDAEKDVTRKNAQSYLDTHQINKILNAYNNFEDIEGFAKVVSNDSIINAGAVLSISYYVEGVTEENIDFGESLEDWKTCRISHNNEFNSLIKLINNGTENL